MDPTKRQNLPPGLWVVATPIGNLSDVSLRARNALEEARLIFCEDTRRTRVLLSALGLEGIPKRLHRLDAHSSPKEIQKWAEQIKDAQIKEGCGFALVTDAGTPSISDPGAFLVARAHEAGVRVTPIPGPSAVITLLSIAGFPDTSFTFHGYFPRKQKEKEEVLKTIQSFFISRVHVWFESPLRLKESLSFLRDVLPYATMIVAKELTKLHEKIFWGSVLSVTQRVLAELEEQGEIGEWCFALNFAEEAEGKGGAQGRNADPILKTKLRTHAGEGSGDWMKALECLIQCKVSVRESSDKISQSFGISKRIAYEAALRLAGKKTNGGLDPA